MPSYSIGFSVASRRNGDGSARVTPSTVTCCSAIASSSADCVFGVARLISSTRTTFAKIGPGRNSKFLVLLVEDGQPGHVGRLQVGVHWIRCGNGALDAPRDRSRENRLGGARDVLEEDVTVARERGQDELDLVALAVDDRLDVVDEPIGDHARALEALGLRRDGDDRLHRRDGSWGRMWDRARHAARYATSTPRGAGC